MVAFRCNLEQLLVLILVHVIERKLFSLNFQNVFYGILTEGGLGGPPPRKKFKERNEMVASGVI